MQGCIQRDLSGILVWNTDISAALEQKMICFFPTLQHLIPINLYSGSVFIYFPSTRFYLHKAQTLPPFLMAETDLELFEVPLVLLTFAFPFPLGCDYHHGATFQCIKDTKSLTFTQTVSCKNANKEVNLLSSLASHHDAIIPWQSRGWARSNNSFNFVCGKLAETNAKCVFLPFSPPSKDKQHLIMCMRHYPDEQPCRAKWKWSH